MDEWIELEGTSRKDAIERACNALNTNTTHLEYELVQNGSRTKIRARKLDVPVAVEEKPEPPKAREPEKRSAEPPRRPARFERPGRRAREENDRAPGGTDEPGVRAEGEERAKAGTEETKPALPPDPLFGQKAQEALEGLIKFVDDGARVERKETPDDVYLEIFADNAAILIGKHGQTLSALQYLVMKMLGADRSTGKRLVVDSEQYRARRQESLEGLAHNLAARARKAGRPVGAEPMNAGDRRILHMALADDPHVSTKSVGEGSQRKVLVVPREERGQQGGRGGGFRGGRPEQRGRGERPAGNRDAAERRRPGPPALMHDSFDAPAASEVDLFEEDPDAPEMEVEHKESVGAHEETNGTADTREGKPDAED